jgi:hypothetical protein
MAAQGVGAMISPTAYKRSWGAHFTQFRDWLLPMLMNGQVTVA